MQKTITILILLLALLLTASGCTTHQEPETGKINVVVSILPQKEFVMKVGKERVEVQALVPPGASPATYNPKPSDLASVEKARIYFQIGLLPFEKAYSKTFKNLNPQMQVASASEVVALRHFAGNEEHAHGEEEPTNEEKEIDPHLWLSLKNVEKHVEQIYKELAGIDPKNSGYYKKNAEGYISRIKALDQELGFLFSETKTGKLLVFHPSWGYFADDYGLEQVAIEHSGKEPTAKQLQDLINFAKENSIKFIFVQEQFSTQSAEALAAEVGATVMQINPLAENYLENMEKIGKEIAERLS